MCKRSIIVSLVLFLERNVALGINNVAIVLVAAVEWVWNDIDV